MRKFSILGFVFLLAGCAGLKPDYAKPAADLPAGWRDAPADGVQAGDARWWKVYADPVLDRLVDEALAHNANVMLAVARVDEARAALSATAADQRPQINASASRSRTRISQRGPTPLSPGFNPESNDTRAAVGVSYEIDLWGRLRNATQAARADLLATEAARETVLITLTSDVAQGYFALRALDGQLAATRRSLAARSEALGMQKRRFEVGDISEFDYRQLEADVAAERALLPVLELQRAQQENVLAVLLGKSPRAIYEGALEAGSDPEGQTVAIVVPAGLPSDLLLRRPDLVQAEQTLIAANARVSHGVPHWLSGKRERGAVRFIYRAGRNLAGGARSGPADLRGRTPRRAAAGCRCARTPSARPVSARDPECLSRGARRARGASQGARAARG